VIIIIDGKISLWYEMKTYGIKREYTLEINIIKREKRIKWKGIKWNNVDKKAKSEDLIRKVGK